MYIHTCTHACMHPRIHTYTHTYYTVYCPWLEICLHLHLFFLEFDSPETIHSSGSGYIYEHIPLHGSYVNKYLINSVVSIRPDTANKRLSDSEILCNGASKLHQNGNIYLTMA